MSLHWLSHTTDPWDTVFLSPLKVNAKLLVVKGSHRNPVSRLGDRGTWLPQEGIGAGPAVGACAPWAAGPQA